MAASTAKLDLGSSGSTNSSSSFTTAPSSVFFLATNVITTKSNKVAPGPHTMNGSPAGTLAQDRSDSSTRASPKALPSRPSVLALAMDVVTPRSNRVAPSPGPLQVHDSAISAAFSQEPEPCFVIDTGIVKAGSEVVLGVTGEGVRIGVSSGGWDSTLKPASSMKRATSFKLGMRKSASFAPLPEGGRGKAPSKRQSGSGLRRMPTALPVATPKAGMETMKPIHPDSPWYMLWWYFIVFIALWCGFIYPFAATFGAAHGFVPYGSFLTVNKLITTGFVAADIIVKFFLAYKDIDGILVTDFKRIGKNYLRRMFWLDLLFMLPFTGISILIYEATKASSDEYDKNTEICIKFLQFISIGRLYRVFELFDRLDHSMLVSQVKLVLIRNSSYIFFSCHWFACIIYMLAELEFNNGKRSWITKAVDRTEGQPIWVLYLYSLYFSVMVFSGLGDNDFYTSSPLEAAVMVVYLVFNVVLNSYILGTITMLLVKGDEQTADFQLSMNNLKEYARVNKVPESLRRAMADHLELHYLTVQTMEQSVLDIYPEVIRRKARRYLHIGSMRDCYLFKGTKVKCLESLLHAATVQMFMPDVQIMMSGDILTELFMILDGEVEVASSDRERQSIHSMSLTLSDSQSMNSMSSHRCDSNSSVGSAITTGSEVNTPAQITADIRGVSNTFGEVAFFTEDLCHESAWTLSVVRVLVLTKPAFESLAKQFPNVARVVLTNLQSKSAGEMQTALVEAVNANPKIDAGLKVQVNGLLNKGFDPFFLKKFSPARMAIINRDLPRQHLAKLRRMTDITAAVAKYCAKLDEVQIHEMMFAAQLGDMPVIRELLAHGIPATCVDYDNRSALTIAAQNGHSDIVELLINSGADQNRFDDRRGGTAIQEAIDNGHLGTAEVLMKHGAQLGIADEKAIMAMATFLENSDLAKLKYYLRTGANPNILNADGRTLLHYAARVGNLQAVKLLADECPASLDLEIYDNYGRLPLDDAEHNGHVPTANFLRHLIRTKPERTAKHLSIMEAEAEERERQAAVLQHGEDMKPSSMRTRKSLTLHKSGVMDSLGSVKFDYTLNESRRATSEIGNLQRQAIYRSASSLALSKVHTVPDFAIPSYHSSGPLALQPSARSMHRSSITSVPREWSQPFSMSSPEVSVPNVVDGTAPNMSDDQAAAGGLQGIAVAGGLSNGSAQMGEGTNEGPSSATIEISSEGTSSAATELKQDFSVEPFKTFANECMLESLAEKAPLAETNEQDYAQLNTLMSHLLSSAPASPRSAAPIAGADNDLAPDWSAMSTLPAQLPSGVRAEPLLPTLGERESGGEGLATALRDIQDKRAQALPPP